MKFKEYINKHTWLITLFWIVVTALITNSLPKGKYEFCIGFMFEQDIHDEFPKIYQVHKVVNI